MKKTLKYFHLETCTNISIHDYHTLPSKKGYSRVTESFCNVCSDSLDKRLIRFIENN